MADEVADVRASRRGLLGLGAAIAVAAVAADTMVAPADAAMGAPAPAAVQNGRQYSSASVAARKTRVTSTSVFPRDTRAHLLRRATFGPRPRDVAELDRLGIDRWLERQLHPTTIPDPRGDRAWKLYPLAGAGPATIVRRTDRYSWEAGFQTAQASLARQVFSDRQLFEVVVDVFANHLHVPIPGEQWHTAPSYLRDVIRKHAFGRFEDMLLTAMKHPAMLSFLSNDESRRAHVNENLGRELLELHTVGRSAGYTEQEVRASAKILSGRTFDYDSGEYYFKGPWHWRGPVKVLGFSHANPTGSGGEKVGDAYLRYLAHHPSTARNVARKLAVRLVSDTPSADLVNRLAHVYLANGTSIRAVVAAIFKSSDFWASVGGRMRRPLEDAVGALRVLDVPPASGMKTPLGWLYWSLDSAGHAPLGWRPPNGYPDVAAAWLGAGAMIQRWNLHRALAHGWWKHLEPPPASKLVPRTSGMTALQWTRLAARRLLGTVPPKARLLAVLHGAGLSAGSPAPTDDWRCGKITALLLDSPYFQLR